MAEYREIVRVVKLANTAFLKSGSSIKFLQKNLPKEFTLGTGHVKFFYDKLLYIKLRYDRICKELVERGFEITPIKFLLESSHTILVNDWVANAAVLLTVKERIISNASKSTQQIRFHKHKISLEEYKFLILEKRINIDERVRTIKDKYTQESSNRRGDTKKKAGKEKRECQNT
jgi:deoxyribonuclease (pyrimidine dimer)